MQDELNMNAAKAHIFHKLLYDSWINPTAICNRIAVHFSGLTQIIKK